MEEVSQLGERWLPIEGFVGSYEVSDLGRVRSLPRTVPRGNGTYPVRGRILKFRWDEHGRPAVMLHGPGGYERQVFVHHLVLEVFVGPRPDGLECCHFNDDPTDNRLENLRWDTKAANAHDKVRNGGDYNAVKTHCDQGHEFTPENTYKQTKSGRGCKECRRRHIREYMRRHRAKPIDKGTCKHCHKPRESALYKLCDSCRTYTREYSRRYRERNKSS